MAVLSYPNQDHELQLLHIYTYMYVQSHIMLKVLNLKTHFDAVDIKN